MRRAGVHDGHGYPQSGDHTGKPDDLPTGYEFQDASLSIRYSCRGLQVFLRELQDASLSTYGTQAAPPRAGYSYGEAELDPLAVGTLVDTGAATLCVPEHVAIQSPVEYPAFSD